MATLTQKQGAATLVGVLDAQGNFSFVGPFDGRAYVIPAASVAAGFNVTDKGLFDPTVVSSLQQGKATLAETQIALAKLIAVLT